MREQHRPEGPAPTTLEANVLKLRAFEMVLVLFYIEELKNFIIRSIEVTDKIGKKDRLKDGRKPGRKLDLARSVLVAEGIITDAESAELKALIDHRNNIGHEIQNLTVAVGANAHLVFDKDTHAPLDQYDSTAARRVKALREKISNGMGRKFILSIDFDALKFEAAGKTYEREIRRLKAKVNKGIAKHDETLNETNASIKAIPKLVLQLAQPGHPQHQRENGNLTDTGRSCIYQLYDAKAVGADLNLTHPAD